MKYVQKSHYIKFNRISAHFPNFNTYIRRRMAYSPYKFVYNHGNEIGLNMKNAQRILQRIYNRLRDFRFVKSHHQI